jgi:hypothetical protein
MNKDSFLYRDQSIATVNMAMNYLSRVVRENIVLFDYDARTNSASFLTDSQQLVEGVVVVKDGNVSLQNLTANDVNEVYSNESVDSKVTDSVSEFIGSLREDKFSAADNSFTTVLDAFKSRSKINEVRAKLERRNSCFGEAQDIIQTPEYVKLTEVRDQVVAYLKENKETLLGFEDVKNSLTLANALGKAFNCPKRSWEELVKEGTVHIPLDSKKTVFEMVCAQELIRAELSESKENFSRSWVKNPQVAKLASCIYNDDDVVQEGLKEAIASVPYLALASKADIKTVFASIYESSDVANISQKDIREFVARIFEFKKPLKLSLLKELNESYGINVQNLKFVPTFSNLAKAQSVLFETLGTVSEKDTIVRDVFEEFSKVLRKKGGIQALDINDFIFEAFTEAGVPLSDELFRTVDLDNVVGELLEAKDKKEEAKGKKDKKDKKDKKEEVPAIEKDVEDGAEKGMEGDIKGDDSEPLGNEGDEVDPKAKKGTKPDLDDKDDHTLQDEGEEGEGDEIVDEPVGLGLGDSEMGELMQELESIFSEVDWDSLAQEEGEEELEDEAEEDQDPDGEEQGEVETSV